jgi:hypothetical protein
MQMFHCINNTSMSGDGQKLVRVNVLHTQLVPRSTQLRYLVKNHCEFAMKRVVSGWIEESEESEEKGIKRAPERESLA